MLDFRSNIRCDEAVSLVVLGQLRHHFTILVHRIVIGFEFRLPNNDLGS